MIRALERGDSPRLRELLDEFFRELDPSGSIFASDAAATLAGIYIEAPPHKTQARAKIRDDEIAAILLARVEERPLRKARRILFMDAAYTVTAWRGQGLMASLLDDLTAAAKEMNLDEMELATPMSNKIARRYWSKHGFAQSMIGFTREL